MTARAVTRAYNARLRPLNLQATQFTLLVSIQRGGDVPIAALAEQLDMESSTLLRNLKVLETRGLIASGGGRGRRGRRLVLTDLGVRLLEQAAPIWVQAQADMTEAMGGEADTVRSALGQLETAALELEEGRQL
jgi:DNA-binding MarR family transcriptional regulator